MKNKCRPTFLFIESLKKNIFSFANITIFLVVLIGSNIILTFFSLSLSLLFRSPSSSSYFVALKCRYIYIDYASHIFITFIASFFFRFSSYIYFFQYCKYIRTIRVLTKKSGDSFQIIINFTPKGFKSEFSHSKITYLLYINK